MYKYIRLHNRKIIVNDTIRGDSDGSATSNLRSCFHFCSRADKTRLNNWIENGGRHCIRFDWGNTAVIIARGKPVQSRTGRVHWQLLRRAV